MEFYNLAINEKNFEAAEKYIGDTYIQHNPIAADGDYVILHVHAKRTPDDRGSAVMDIFRLDENGKVVKHWDVIQEIPPPEKRMNDNGMF